MNTAMKKVLLPLLAVIALLLVVAWMAGIFSDRTPPGLLPAGESLPLPQQAFTAEIVVTPISESVPATIGARQETTISSRIIARITRIAVRAGDTVNEGDLLLELESSDLESRLSQANEQIRAIRARLTEAKLSLERAENLQKQGLVAKAVLDEARASHDTLTAQLANAQRAAEEAQVAISYTQIRAPFNGRVVDRFAEPGDTASPGERLMTLYNPLSLRIEAAVRESLALSLELGQQLDVDIPALNRRLTAQIEERVPAADPGSRSFLVKASIEFQPDLLPGMYARLHIPAGEEQLLLIPRALVKAYGQLDLVWVYHEQGAERRFLRLGRAFESDQVEVLSGLQAGEILIPQP
jgi:RND family efflux transporter MFP subunit